MILKHRDKELLRFDWIGDARVRIVSVNDAERRHLGNFGYLVDNNTNEIVDVAPIFDNGYGLMPHLEVSARSAENNYYAIRNYLRDKRRANHCRA